MIHSSAGPLFHQAKPVMYSNDEMVGSYKVQRFCHLDKGVSLLPALQPKPFRWTKSADQILASIARFAINTGRASAQNLYEKSMTLGD